MQKLESDGVISSYIHAGGKIGVLVEADASVVNDAVTEALKTIAMQIAAMNPQYICKKMIFLQMNLLRLREITIDSALNEPDTLPKPILNELTQQGCRIARLWSDEDIAIYEEKKSNMNYLFNFLSKEAKAAVAEIAMNDKAEIHGKQDFQWFSRRSCIKAA